MIWKSHKNIRSWLPRLQCHRGFWVNGLRQNSIESIKKSFELGYEMCEFDVRITKDDRVVLFHDSHINGLAINKITLSKLQEMTHVNLLEDLLLWFSLVEKFKLNIEIKNDGLFNLKIEKKVCELVRKYKIEERILISSFNPFSLAKVRLFNANIFRALLLTFEDEPGNNWVIKSQTLNILGYPHILHLRWQDYVKYKNNFKLLANNIPIGLWTVNNVEIFNSNKNEIYGVISDEITPEQIR